MDLADLIAPEAVFPGLKAKTKKQALQELAERAAKLTGLDARDILVELGKRKVVGGQEDMITEVAMMLAEKQKQRPIA